MALHELDRDAYVRFFEGADVPRVNLRLPRYLLRPALGPKPEREPLGYRAAMELLLWGGTSEEEERLVEAWRAAGKAGLGRARAPFRLDRVEPLYGGEFSASIVDVMKDYPQDAPCRLDFLTPVRLFNRWGAKIDSLNAEDYLRAALSRLTAVMASAARPSGGSAAASEFVPDFVDELYARAKEIPAVSQDWQGVGIRRYSGRQKRELALEGSMGSTFFPQGLGALTPILAAAEALHLGKSTTLGLGRFQLGFET